ncbi:glutaredoxin family protein [Sulfuriferula sp. GW1]|uniref:glutaredoxin family protein n=1 Tax=Sulfuriferula sp. GW1 TaxID=3345111 RepID=UPI0039AF0CA0
MKWFFRMFFKTLRIVMTPFMLLWEKATTPKGMARPAGAQQLVDRQCQNLALYQFRTCPFCIKVRREFSRLSLDVALLDAQKLPQHREALLQGGGRIKVPCLKITDEQGNSQWMYESSAIIQYLHGRFA